MTKPPLPSYDKACSPIYLCLLSQHGWWFAVLLGLGLRTLHFLRVPSVWHDEAALLVNVINLPFGHIFGSLAFHEAAPPLFLLLEQAVCFLGGDGIQVLRLLPFLASCIALVLFALVARHVLPGWPSFCAVALFAISDRMLWHSVEAKPYTVDVLVAVLAIYSHVATRNLPLGRQFLFALPILPALLWVSYPACFVIGAWLLARLPALCRSRSKADWLLAAALVFAIGISFIALTVGPVRAQRDGPMEACWTAAFPDWQHPWQVPVWAVRSTIDVFTYCLAPHGWMLSILIVSGGWALYRQLPKGSEADASDMQNTMGRDRTLLTVMVAPLALALLASFLGKYPYCGMRVLVFMTPAICLLTAAGIRPVNNWLRRRHWMAVAITCGVLAVPFGHTIYRLQNPWQRADTAGCARYVTDHWQDNDAVCFNFWEGEYYFRSQSSRWFRFGQPMAVPPAPSGMSQSPARRNFASRS